jgi:hypothetical protein
MADYLSGSGWGTVENNRGIDISPCMLVVLNIGGVRYCFGTEDIHVKEFDGKWLHFIGAILNTPSFSESIDIFGSRDIQDRSIKIDVMGSYLSFRDIRKTGVLIQRCAADVYWYVGGIEQKLSQAQHILSGKIFDPVFDSDTNVSSFTVRDYQYQYTRQFPPVVADTEKISTLVSDHVGKVYPVILGTPVKKVPMLEINDGTLNEFLCCLDKNNSLSGNPVTAAYDGDVEVVISSQGQQTDDDGNHYWRVVLDDVASSLDVTADFSNSDVDASPGGVIEHLFQYFSNIESNMFDRTSLRKLNVAFPGIKIGAIINQIIDGGALGFIKSRLMKQIPFALKQEGGKYSFVPLLWGRDVVKKLSSKKNIFAKVEPVVETGVDKISNSFVFKYGVSGLRGDSSAVIERTPDNDIMCKVSKRRYGDRGYSEVTLADIISSAGANIIANWYIETLSKVRIFVSYDCTLDAASIRLWDTVSVYDDDEGWTHEPLFKVVGIHKSSRSLIRLDLVSVDDYIDVYGINK